MKVERRKSNMPIIFIFRLHFLQYMTNCNLISYGLHNSMIKKFKHKGLRKPFELGNTNGVQSQYSKRIKRILVLLETAGSIEDMDLPDLNLHELRGDRSGI